MSPQTKKLSGAGGIVALLGVMLQMLHAEQQALRKENQELRDRVVVLETLNRWNHGIYEPAEAVAKEAVKAERAKLTEGE